MSEMEVCGGAGVRSWELIGK
uniref:Uncharacterized protein n=1 Tax=Arundo donax TaxID=35708 RepID=A0A0A9CDW2_ARUDO